MQMFSPKGNCWDAGWLGLVFVISQQRLAFVSGRHGCIFLCLASYILGLLSPKCEGFCHIDSPENSFGLADTCMCALSSLLTTPPTPISSSLILPQQRCPSTILQSLPQNKCGEKKKLLFNLKICDTETKVVRGRGVCVEETWYEFEFYFVFLIVVV